MTGYYVTYIRKLMFPRAWGHIFWDLSEERAGKLIQALYDFIDGQEDVEKELPNDLRSIFLTMAEEMESSAEKYCQKARLADYE